jgi:hypothetical protein
MHNIHDVKSICNQNVIILKWNVKWGIRDTKY